MLDAFSLFAKNNKTTCHFFKTSFVKFNAKFQNVSTCTEVKIFLASYWRNFAVKSKFPDKLSSGFSLFFVLLLSSKRFAI